MKKFLSFLAIALLSIVALSSCVKESVSHKEKQDTEAVDSYMNPEFSDVAEFMVYHDIEATTYQQDKMFYEMKPDIIKQVATVCLKKNHKITKKLFMQEYLDHTDVYNYLSADKDKPIEPLEALKPDSPDTVNVE